MGAKLTPRSGEFDRHAVYADFEREGLRPHSWSNGPHDRYGAHSHGYHKVLYCLEGSVVFRLPETGENIELRPGDRLDIEPGTMHSADVGARGVTCVEAPRN
jgi:quercetin dioxygenase-like cupin family protein